MTTLIICTIMIAVAWAWVFLTAVPDAGEYESANRSYIIVPLLGASVICTLAWLAILLNKVF